MSFDIKYDAEGKVISTTFKENKEPEVQVSEEMSQPEEPAIEAQSEALHENSNQESEFSAEDSSSHNEPQVTRHEAPAQETPKERNMRILREAKEAAERERIRVERERDDAIRRAEEIERRYARKPQAQEEEGDDIPIGEDDLAEGKHLKKVYREIKDLKKQVEYYKQNSQTQTLESRIRSEFPDFAQVVTPDNITILKSLKPRQAALLDNSPDVYQAAATAYEMIKEYVLPPQDTFIQQKQVAQRNAAKPRPVTSLAPQQSDSPLSKANAFANGLTPELMAQLRREMADAMKGH